MLTTVGSLQAGTLAVVPVLVGPLQTLLALLPAILAALGGLILAMFRPSGLKKILRFFWKQKIFTAVLVLTIASIWTRFPWSYLGGGGGAAVGKAAAGTEWSAFRGGPSRSGAAPGSADPTLAEPVWAFNRDRTFYSSPAVSGNRVYATTAEKGIYADRGAVVCLDAETGAEVWRYSPRDFRATFSSPAVKGDYVVCGEGLHFTREARITCLDLSGRRLWEFRTASHVESSPCVYNGKVYIGAGDDGFYCLKLDPGLDGEPRVLWHLEGERYRDCEASPVAWDGVVYFGLGQGGQAICAVRADDGTELWRLQTPYPVFAPPTLAEGRLFVGMGNGNFIETAEQVRAKALRRMREEGRSAEEIAEAEKSLGPAGEVWCVDLKEREVEWKFAVGRTVLGAIAYGEGRLYFGSRDGYFYCVSMAGKLIRRWNAREPIITSPALGKDYVYFATQAGRLHCLRAEALQPAWDARLGAGTNFMSSPALANGHVYIGTEQDGLRCIGRVGERPPPLWNSGVRGGTADASLVPAGVRFSWRYPKSGADEFEVTAPLMPFDGYVFAACVNDSKPALVKLRPGRGLGDEARLVWSAPFDRPIRVAPAGAGGEIYVSEGEAGGSGRALHCLDAETGRRRWSAPVSPDASGRFGLDHRRVVIWQGRGTLACLDRLTGERLWTARRGRGVGEPLLTDGIVLAALESGVAALDDETGTTLWSAPVLSGPVFGPVRVGNGIILAAGDGLSRRSIIDGATKWKVRTARPATPPVLRLDTVAAVTDSGELVVLDAEDGTVLARVAGAKINVPPLLTERFVVFGDSKDLAGLELEPRRTSRWFGPAGWLGEMTTPVVILGEHAYFATDKKGVVCLRPKR